MRKDERTGTKKLLIVFVKNIKLGKVKTRLAESIGDDAAFEVYKTLVDITEKATVNIDADKSIYFSDVTVESKWRGVPKFVQSGVDLGERMKNAFAAGFEHGYKQIVLIGSDLPDISKEIIETAFKKLEKKQVVFGPADDGGYYLVGLTTLNSSIFQDKPWSRPNLLDYTLEELKDQKVDFDLLASYNDVDTYEDLKNSSLFNEYKNRKPTSTK